MTVSLMDCLIFFNRDYGGSRDHGGVSSRYDNYPDRREYGGSTGGGSGSRSYIGARDYGELNDIPINLS